MSHKETLHKYWLQLVLGFGEDFSKVRASVFLRVHVNVYVFHYDLSPPLTPKGVMILNSYVLFVY